MTLTNKRIETYYYDDFQKECVKLQKKGYELRYSDLKAMIFVNENFCVTVKLHIVE